VTTEKIYEFVLEDYNISLLRQALEGYRYAVASVIEDDEKKKTDEALESVEIGHNMVEDLDELIKFFSVR
jgi:hypothetical protein